MARSAGRAQHVHLHPRGQAQPAAGPPGQDGALRPEGVGEVAHRAPEAAEGGHGALVGDGVEGDVDRGPGAGPERPQGVERPGRGRVLLLLEAAGHRVGVVLRPRHPHLPHPHVPPLLLAAEAVDVVAVAVGHDQDVDHRLAVDPGQVGDHPLDHVPEGGLVHERPRVAAAVDEHHVVALGPGDAHHEAVAEADVVHPDPHLCGHSSSTGVWPPCRRAKFTRIRPSAADR